MSRAIDSLRKPPSKDNLFHEHIVSTYFYQKTRKKKNRFDTNKLILPLAVSLFAILVSSVIILATIFINKYNLEFVREKAQNANTIELFHNGRINSDFIKNFEFHGLARINSKLSADQIIFINPQKYNWANISFDFKVPIDLSHRHLSLTIKGETGGEKMFLILRDKSNRSYRLKDLYASADWKTEPISLRDIRQNIDLSNITHMRLESGYTGETPAPARVGLTIYIKNIKIARGA